MPDIASNLQIYGLRAHIAALDAAGLLYRIDAPVNKDTELHPLVRWQYRGGLSDDARKAFLFTHVTDATGRRFEAPLLVAAFAGSRAIYALGMQAPIESVGTRWAAAYANPIPPILTESGPVQEVIHAGSELLEWGGLLNLPVPISTPGFDNAPYLSSAHFITKDPDTGVRNVGNYRGQIKAADRLGINFADIGNDASVHWRKMRARGEHLPVAIVIGAPPAVAYTAVQRMPIDIDELAISGGLAGEPIVLVPCKSVPLEVPADAELVIEGFMRTDYLEPEGPFGESHGFIHPRCMMPAIHVTCITHRKDFIMTSFISQVTPSESSTIKRAAYEPMLLAFLRDTCSVKSLVRVFMHEALTNIRPVIFLQFGPTSKGEIWRALKLASSFALGVGKLVIAIDGDIDPANLDAVMWALAYRMVPHVDIQIIRGYDKGHAPPFREVGAMDNSVALIDATLDEPLPPISLPKQPFMERSLALWKELGLPEVTPQVPWYGYSLGIWPDDLDAECRLATEGRWLETGAQNLRERISALDNEPH